MLSKNYKSQISSLGQELGFDQVGYCKLNRPLSIEFYKTWLASGNQGEMKYLEDHLPLKETPQLKLPFAKSVIVLSKNYFNFSTPDFPLTNLKIARYARGEDYHNWLLKSLKELSQKLKNIYPDEEFFCSTDAYPFLERDSAYQSGLGWFGKNTCIIDKKEGSFFLLGEIFTSLHLENDFLPSTNFCGTCQKCIEECPTEALSLDNGLDARKCISYWTIESRKIPPPELSDKFGDNFFGCDICQDVCPWNQKKHPELKNKSENTSDIKKITAELKLILNSSNNELQRIFKNTPLSRAGGRGLKKNALIVIKNLKLKELKQDILDLYKSDYIHDDLRKLAKIVLSELD